MTLDLRLIRQAQALSQQGSFSRAAGVLGIAQPTLSRNIKDLEDELGLKLFSRHRYGVAPTDFGNLFLQQAAMVVAQVADLEREVALAKGLNKGELSVAFGPYAAEALLPKCLRRFASAHPSVRLRIQVDALETLGRSLRARSADIVVGEASVLEVDEAIEVVARLTPVRAYVMARSGHPLAASANVSMADVLDYPFVQIARLPLRVLKPILTGRRAPKAKGPTTLPFPAIECPTVPLGVAAIIDSNALMLASLAMLRRELNGGRVVPVLHEPWMRSDWAIMRLRGRTLGPAATAFVGELHRAHDALQSEESTLGRRWALGAPSTSKRAVGNARLSAPKV
jgi:DNA-binding transcriptional LysR family regulator